LRPRTVGPPRPHQVTKGPYARFAGIQGQLTGRRAARVSPSSSKAPRQNRAGRSNMFKKRWCSQALCDRGGARARQPGPTGCRSHRAEAPPHRARGATVCHDYPVARRRRQERRPGADPVARTDGGSPLVDRVVTAASGAASAGFSAFERPTGRGTCGHLASRVGRDGAEGQALPRVSELSRDRRHRHPRPICTDAYLPSVVRVPVGESGVLARTCHDAVGDAGGEAGNTLRSGVRSSRGQVGNLDHQRLGI
jgi:hypothetical protein